MTRRAETVAAGIPVIPGQTIGMPIEIMLAWLKINDLEIDPRYARKPTGGYLVVTRRKEADVALKETIASMLERSKRTEKPQRIKLAHGLQISIWDRGEEIWLQLAREKVYPSGREWLTVAGYFPPEFRAGQPKQVKHEGLFYLKGSLRRLQ